MISNNSLIDLITNFNIILDLDTTKQSSRSYFGLIYVTKEYTFINFSLFEIESL